MTHHPILLPALSLCAVALGASVLPAQGLRHVRAVDYNPDPRVFETVIFPFETEVQLVGGRKTRVMSYNGSLPGPAIEATVGDRLIIHFLNLLPEPSSLHCHGVALPAQMDGSQIAQPGVPTFGYLRYEFELKSVGTFYYHAHRNTDAQVEKGLTGSLVVRDPRDESRLGIPRSRQYSLLLDDALLDQDNQFAPFASDPKARLQPYERAESQINARPGKHLFVNGRHVTDDDLPTLEVLAGAAYHLRLCNVANGTFFRLGISDPAQVCYHIGSDHGLFNDARRIVPIDKVKNPFGHHNEPVSNPDRRRGLLLTPGDRDEVVLVPSGQVGDEFFIEQHDFYRGRFSVFRDVQGNLQLTHDHFDGAADERRLIRVRIVGQAPGRAWQPPSPLRHDPVRRLQPDPQLPALPVILGHLAPDRVTGHTTFFAQVKNPATVLQLVQQRQAVPPATLQPLTMAMHGPNDGFHVKVGQTRYYEVINFTASDHNFHSHGFRFQHLETVYVDLDDPGHNRTEQPLQLSWEDVIYIPKRPSHDEGRGYTITRLAVRFDDTDKPGRLRRRPAELLAGGLTPTARSSGGWLWHCKVLPQSSAGMMSFTTVRR